MELFFYLSTIGICVFGHCQEGKRMLLLIKRNTNLDCILLVQVEGLVMISVLSQTLIQLKELGVGALWHKCHCW